MSQPRILYVMHNHPAVNPGGAEAYALELHNFEAAVGGDAPPLLGRDDAVAQARAIAALYRSVDEGRPIDPDER